ncbi:MAG: hypothetical protein PVF40_11700 [Ectothiorhodospiraceae bacterium]|jgi:hypothetical protein
MAGILLLTGVVALITAFGAALSPNRDEARLAQARRELKRSGRGYARGSAEEARALRILLEGGNIENV